MKKDKKILKEKSGRNRSEELTLLVKFITNPLVSATWQMDKSDILFDCSGNEELAENMIDLAETTERAMLLLKSTDTAYFGDQGHPFPSSLRQ